MPLRRLLFAVLLACPLSFAVSALAQGGEGSDGERELALGREAHARGSYQAAVEHLSRAVEALGRGGEREVLADAYLRLGMAHLIGLESPAQALPAFLSSAELTAEPATAYLWAALAAEKLGQAAVAARLEAKALARAVAAPAPAPAETAPPPVVQREAPVAVEAGKATGEKVDAFQYFFGGKKQKPAERPREPAASPPGS